VDKYQKGCPSLYAFECVSADESWQLEGGETLWIGGLQEMSMCWSVLYTGKTKA
jgi:hypothetical protein